MHFRADAIDRSFNRGVTKQGMANSPIEAAREAISNSVHAIIISITMTLFGLMPLAFIPGEGAQLCCGGGP